MTQGVLALTGYEFVVLLVFTTTIPKMRSSLSSGDRLAFLCRQAAALPVLRKYSSPASLSSCFRRAYSHFSSLSYSVLPSFSCPPDRSYLLVPFRASSLVSRRFSRRCFPYVTAYAPRAATLQVKSVRAPGSPRDVIYSRNRHVALTPSAGEATCGHAYFRHSRTPLVCPCARLGDSPPGCELMTRFFSGSARRSSSSDDVEEHQQLKSSSAAESVASPSVTTTPHLSPSDAAALDSFRAPTSAPQSTSRSPAASFVAPVGSVSASSSHVNAGATPLPSSSFSLGSSGAVTRSGASVSVSSSAPAMRVASSSGAPTAESRNPAAATPHAPRLHRLVLPPTLPPSLKDSGEGKAAIAAAMERALEGRSADQHKLVLGRKLSGNDHMRMVVPRERKKRTKHTGGQNATY